MLIVQLLIVFLQSLGLLTGPEVRWHVVLDVLFMEDRFLVEAQTHLLLVALMFILPSHEILFLRNRSFKDLFGSLLFDLQPVVCTDLLIDKFLQIVDHLLLKVDRIVVIYLRHYVAAILPVLPN